MHLAPNKQGRILFYGSRSLGRGVMVAQQTLTLFVKVRVLTPQLFFPIYCMQCIAEVAQITWDEVQ